MASVLIIGATSGIAEAAARVYASRGDRLFLIGRNQDRLDAIAADLRQRGAHDVGVDTLDVADIAMQETVLKRLWDDWGAETGIDTVLIAHGVLPDQKRCDTDVDTALNAFAVNAGATIALMINIAWRLELQGRGRLAVISSVAGDRGRASNALYGAAKAAVTEYASGLRQRLRGTGVKVVTIKPGPVATRMTTGMRKGLLWATPKSIAKPLVAAVDAGRPVVYLPGYWRHIMAVIRAVPEPVFARLSL